MTAIAVEHVHRALPTRHRVPLTRVTQVELRKMFDTRSGFWLIASIAISAVLATGVSSCGRRTISSPTPPSRPPSAFRW